MSTEARRSRDDDCWLDHADFSLHPTTVNDALLALDGVTQRFLRAGDPRAAFPDIYAVITRKVAERAGWGPRRYFLEPAWMSRVSARFCEQYLETLRRSLTGHAQDSRVWAATYALCDRADAPPIQHAFLGLTAHINFDLAIGIAGTLAEHGCASDPAKLSRCKHDHDLVNELLRTSFPEALECLVSRHDCATSGLFLERVRRPAEWMTLGILGTWRERVWDDAIALLRTTTDPQRDGIVSRMDRRSFRIGRSLASLVPGPQVLASLAYARTVGVG